MKARIISIVSAIVIVLVGIAVSDEGENKKADQLSGKIEGLFLDNIMAEELEMLKVWKWSSVI